jgi:Flp pilus assembly CpaF family ATPase
MYSVEMEENCSIITTLDEDDAYEDVKVTIANDGTVYMQQYNEGLIQEDMIYMSYSQLKDILNAIHSPEGCYYVVQKVTI